ncbi:MAG: toxin TcdB middle/C-terminal domain-containing protein, partial [Kofleriaceae bacterium]
ERVEVTDRWRGTSFATTYSYHHGYFDGIERELRGFARVEQIDLETSLAPDPADEPMSQPPVKTITWFHTGASVELAGEFYRPGGEHALPALALPETPDVEERREALRAAKGRMVRQEIYELEVAALARGAHVPVRLFTTASHNQVVARLQPRGPNRHAVFLASESEAITYHYDMDLRGPIAPDPRVAHTLNLAIDEYGNVVQGLAVTYPRRGTHVDATLPAGIEAKVQQVQRELHVTYTERRLTNGIDDATGYRTPAAYETLAYEVTGLAPAHDYFTFAELGALELSDVYPPQATPTLSVRAIAYHQLPSGGRERRLVERGRTLYCDPTLVAPRAAGQIDALGLPFEHYKLALTDALLTSVLGAKLTPSVRAQLVVPTRSGYLEVAGEIWMRSGRVEVDPARFYLPVRYADSFGQPTSLTYAYDLLVASIRDAAQNVNTVTAFDYRVLAPARSEDSNGSVTEVAFDALGAPVAMALVTPGDRVAGVDATPSIQRVTNFFTAAYDETEAAALLHEATARYVYSHGQRVEADGSISWGNHPACAATIARETHAVAGRLQIGFEYSDGSGNVLVKKSKAEPAPGTTAARWIASGKTVLNNKGKPIEQYEPYFSSNEHRFEEVLQVGVSAVLYYDASDRVVRTVAPDGSYTRVDYSPWHVARFDPNDTIGEPGNAWYAVHSATTSSAEDQRAAASALVHTDTPAITLLDSLGRDAIAIAVATAGEKYVTVTRLDAEGKPLWIRDARGNLVMQYIQPPMADDAATDATTGFVPCYDLAGNLLFQHGMDSGDAWTLNDATGKPMFAWTTNERAGVREDRFVEARYDALHRPTEVWLTTNAQPAELVERRRYGEGVPNDRARNLRGRLFEHDDPSGRVQVILYDFAGRTLEVART